MSYAIAAAGTGGHVFPALAVAEALLQRGVTRSDIVFVGGDRLEATVFPAEGFPFAPLDLQSLRRSLTPRNLLLPLVVARAARRAQQEMADRGVKVVLAMGSYVTVPVGWAARRLVIPLFLHEQNAEAGLANRVMSRLAKATFVSFADTKGIGRQVLAGNPVRRSLAGFTRPELRHQAMNRYGLSPGPVVIGVFGGSLGAGAINQAVTSLVQQWSGPPIQILHLAGRAHEDDMRAISEQAVVPWTILGFEEEMQYFYAACDIVIARAGGAVAEIAVTGTPAVLVPGRFGGGHQMSNAARFEDAGAAVVVTEERLGVLPQILEPLVADSQMRRRMTQRLKDFAHPEAADVLARELQQAHG
ncbi:MAG TPA: UDP-N-acetylglucosamine--N-acetylmuramyl-(pentapeptide) pyrophosphoryl-undecaprenol N-acetylglucosamine transferase [Acidimicrobiia bacterium]|nr:UDP-N-acetylglucosamine--N-acetylmuramyl-(pentapeptide) pyrophosphoryl-undecaprenol N-acetylglucosamine transferase [Acidimicrobiia bacterium]